MSSSCWYKSVKCVNLRNCGGGLVQMRVQLYHGLEGRVADEDVEEAVGAGGGHAGGVVVAGSEVARVNVVKGDQGVDQALIGFADGLAVGPVFQDGEKMGEAGVFAHVGVDHHGAFMHG